MVLTFYTFDLVHRMIRNLEQSSKAADRTGSKAADETEIDSKAAGRICSKALAFHVHKHRLVCF